jgi:hypothetical protein
MIALSLTTVSTMAVDGNKAQYVGGTLALQEKAEAPFITNDEAGIRFDAKNKGKIEIPYTSITGLEYGQKAGRRVAVAVLVSPLALFSKKRNHYLTITFNDASGKEQAGVFELGKDIVRTTLTVLEVRTGKGIEYQDEEARKSGIGVSGSSTAKPLSSVPASASSQPTSPVSPAATDKQQPSTPVTQPRVVERQSPSDQASVGAEAPRTSTSLTQTGPAVEGRSPQQVVDQIGKPQYILEGRDGVATWFYEIEGKAVRVFIFENKASLTRQK